LSDEENGEYDDAVIVYPHPVLDQSGPIDASLFFLRYDIVESIGMASTEFCIF
jgi:hypothetical protein